jgi:signal transduction histidine kinase
MQVSTQNIIFIVVVITLIFLVAGISILMYVRLYNQRKKTDQEEKQKMKKLYEDQLLRSQIEVQESTITAISKELHDNVGQLLSTTKMLLGITEINLSPVPDTLVTANATLSKAIQELRFVSRSLDKEWLEQFNFIENLESEIRRINAGGTIQASYTNTVSFIMSPDEQLILFRIVQESIQNALKHAEPGSISVSVSGTPSLLEIVVCNDGKPLLSEPQGMGSNNMKRRVQLFAGKIEWRSLNGSTEVRIVLPVKNTYEDQSGTGR